MRLQLQGIVGTGVALLDAGITDLETAVIDGVVHLYTTTGRNGGLVEYVVGGDGQVTARTTVIYPPTITGVVSDDLVLADDGNGPVLMVGGRAQGLLGYALQANGGLGGLVTPDWAQAQGAAAQGSGGHVAALVAMSDVTYAQFPANVDCSQLVELVGVTVGGQTYYVAACGAIDGVVTLRVNAATGQMALADSMGTDEGLGVHLPSAIEVVQIGGQTYVLVAGAGTSSISVMRMAADGSLTPTDHVIDTGATRFEGVQAMAVAQSGDHVFVVAGGADNGVTLFLLLPDGTLVALQSLGDGAATSMHTVTAIDLVVDGDALHAFVGSQNEAGVTHFTLDLSMLGDLIQGTAAAETLTGTAGGDILMARGSGDTLNGGAGDDVLVADTGSVQMTGGAGADIYVIRDETINTTITDFAVGIDRLDLSDLPMLRDVRQLSIAVTANGAVITYRGHTIRVVSADGHPLTAADLFPGGFDWGDHFPWVPPDDTGGGGGGNQGRLYPIPTEPHDGADPNVSSTTPLFVLPPVPAAPTNGAPTPGKRLTGTTGNDSYFSGDGDDTVYGGDGNDTLFGGAGNDLLQGGAGNDLIKVLSGNNTLLGGDGNDKIIAADGHDSIDCGSGNDRAMGYDGNDTIDGGAGNDKIGAGAGDDYVTDPSGRNKIFGGDGNDTLVGGIDDDKIFGGDGDDLISGGDGNDTLGGGLGDDVLYGGAGNDIFYDLVGADLFVCGEGSDTVWAGLGNDTVYGDGGRDVIMAGDGHDVVFGGAGNDLLYGKTGNDRIEGGADDDAIWGDEGHDTLRGGTGNDWLSGGDGNDMIYGDAGNDTLRGGPGYDLMWGGAGADVFEFFADHGIGRVMDFNPGEGDVIRLDDWIWQSLGALSASEVVERFGAIDADGNIVLDFSDIGGNVVILDGYDDIDLLPLYIEII